MQRLNLCREMINTLVHQSTIVLMIWVRSLMLRIVCQRNLYLQYKWSTNTQNISHIFLGTVSYGRLAKDHAFRIVNSHISPQPPLQC